MSPYLSLILGAVASYSVAGLAIVGVVLVVGVGVLVFQWGWATLMNMPGGLGYDASKGSGISRWKKSKYEGKGMVRF